MGEFEEVEHYNARLEDAARNGDLATIKELITAVHDLDLEGAFAIAADSGQHEAAGLLEAAGADIQFEKDVSGDCHATRCPVCYRQVGIGAMDTCEHWICTTSM